MQTLICVLFFPFFSLLLLLLLLSKNKSLAVEQFVETFKKKLTGFTSTNLHFGFCILVYHKLT